MVLDAHTVIGPLDESLTLINKVQEVDDDALTETEAEPTTLFTPTLFH